MKRPAVVVCLAVAAIVAAMEVVVVSQAGLHALGPSLAAVALALAGLALYWLPSYIARRRAVPNVGSVVVINFLAGWSGIGWVIALAMACRSIPAVVPQPPAPWPHSGPGGEGGHLP